MLTQMVQCPAVIAPYRAEKATNLGWDISKIN